MINLLLLISSIICVYLANKSSILSNELQSKELFIKQQNISHNLERLYYRQMIFNTTTNTYNSEFEWIHDSANYYHSQKIKQIAALLKLDDVIPKSYDVDIINGTETSTIIAREILKFGDSNLDFMNTQVPPNNPLSLEVWRNLDERDKDTFIKSFDYISFGKMIFLAAVIDFHDFSMRNIILQYSNETKLIHFKIVNTEKNQKILDYELFKSFDNEWMRKAFDHENEEIRKIISNTLANLHIIQKMIGQPIMEEDIRARVVKYRNIVFY